MKAGRTIEISLCALCLFLIICAFRPQSSTAQLEGGLPPSGQNQENGAGTDNTSSKQCPLRLDIRRDEYEKNKEACDRFTKEHGYTFGNGPNDGWIATKMYAMATRGENLSRGANITAEVNDGVLTLRGTVDSAVNKGRATEAAKKIDGVKGEVKNNLTVGGNVVNATGGSGTNTTSNVSSTNTDSNANRNANANSNTNTNTNTNTGGGFFSFNGITDLLYPLLIILAGAVILGALIYGLLHLRNKLKAAADAYFAAVRERQKVLAAESNKLVGDLSKKVDASFAEQRETIGGLDRRLNTIRLELEALRKAGAVQPPQGAYPGYQSPVYEVKVEEPAFPTSAEDYLIKMQRSASVVKPDFLNGILVKDPEGGGELVLVEDYSAPGGLLYVIPRVSNLRTKQDFHNYYEKYYDCYRPAAGEVWIKEPAVVDKVTGGWKLRDKGEMEIR